MMRIQALALVLALAGSSLVAKNRGTSADRYAAPAVSAPAAGGAGAPAGGAGASSSPSASSVSSTGSTASSKQLPKSAPYTDAQLTTVAKWIAPRVVVSKGNVFIPRWDVKTSAYVAGPLTITAQASWDKAADKAAATFGWLKKQSATNQQGVVGLYNADPVNN